MASTIPQLFSLKARSYMLTVLARANYKPE
jgi:hypothetical protein